MTPLAPRALALLMLAVGCQPPPTPPPQGPPPVSVHGAGVHIPPNECVVVTLEHEDGTRESVCLTSKQIQPLIDNKVPGAAPCTSR